MSPFLKIYVLGLLAFGTLGHWAFRLLGSYALGPLGPLSTWAIRNLCLYLFKTDEVDVQILLPTKTHFDSLLHNLGVLRSLGIVKPHLE